MTAAGGSVVESESQKQYRKEKKSGDWEDGVPRSKKGTFEIQSHSYSAIGYTETELCAPAQDGGGAVGRNHR